MILNELFTLSELSPDTLASYKKKAGADASAADAAGNYARGNKRFKGIVKATKKQFANDTKGVAESRDYSAVTNAITRRIITQHPEVLAKYGPDVVGQAIDEIADFVGDVDEIGSSDVSGWTSQVIRSLARFAPLREQGVAEGSLEEIDRRGFLKGAGAAVVAGAAGGAKADWEKEPDYKDPMDDSVIKKWKNVSNDGQATLRFLTHNGERQLTLIRNGGRWRPSDGIGSRPDSGRIRIDNNPVMSMLFSYAQGPANIVMITGPDGAFGTPAYNKMVDALLTAQGRILIDASSIGGDILEFRPNMKESVEQGMAEGAAKFDPKTGLPVGQQLSEFGGDATEFMPPTQSTPTTEQPPRRGYSIILTGKPGKDWMAEYAWQALEAVFPREYPGDSSVSNYSGDKTVTPAMQKVLQAHNGPVVVKTGITSEDIAETLVAKLAANRVPAQYWRITSEDLDEGVTEGINDRGFFNNVEQWHEAKSEIEHDDQWETPKYIVVKNNGKTVAKWSKADNYGWVDSSEQGVSESSNPESQKFGNYIKKYFGQIYDYGDDGLEYLDNNAPFWAMLFDKHDGDIDYIIAMEPADVLKKAALELKAVAGDLKYELDEQGVAEAADNELQSMLKSAGIVRNI